MVVDENGLGCHSKQKKKKRERTRIFLLKIK